MAVKSAKTIDVWKTKKWFPIMAPKVLRGAFIGETPAASIENAFGRNVNISLAAVTGDFKRQNVNVTFEITGADDGKLQTIITKIEMVPSHIRRCVKKGKVRIDDSFICKTSDNVQLRIKPFFVTMNKVKGSRKTLLVKLARTTFRDMIGKIPYDKFLEDTFSTRLQKEMKGVLKKVAPLKSCEIRMAELIKEKKPAKKPEDIPPLKSVEKPVAEIKEEKPEKTEEVKEEKPRKKAVKKSSSKNA